MSHEERDRPPEDPDVTDDEPRRDPGTDEREPRDPSDVEGSMSFPGEDGPDVVAAEPPTKGARVAGEEGATGTGSIEEP